MKFIDFEIPFLLIYNGQIEFPCPDFVGLFIIIVFSLSSFQLLICLSALIAV